MADRQPNLNGAYHGPSIPPPAKTYHRHGHRGGGCGCCGCLKCCGCCLFNILITIVVILGIAALIIWLIFRPNAVKFHATDAKLTNFTLDPNNNLHYNLFLNFSIRNPNRRIGIYYDRFEATGYYDGQRFATKELPAFYQGKKNTTDLSTAFQGQSFVTLGDVGRKDLDEDRKSGIYRIDVKLRLRVRFKFGLVKSWRFKPKIKCELKVPLNASGSSSGSRFEATKCDVDF